MEPDIKVRYRGIINIQSNNSMEAVTYCGIHVDLAGPLVLFVKISIYGLLYYFENAHFNMTISIV